jgi:phosphatidylserine/phosphatidylglycerophosphate/cardiolipin synthase-like enzyme
MWNVTSGKVVGSVHQTPINVWGKSEDPKENNDDWFPEKMAEIIGRAHRWADVMSLGPPDGRFLTQFKDALTKLAERAKTAKEPIIVRLLFGNIVGMPVNCGAVIKELTKDLPQDTNMRVWVGAWRKGFSWNHAKLIAVDGVFLHTGGHNLWDKHYLSNNPVHDLSIELEGAVARDGHRFANVQWEFIESNQKTW